MSELIIRFHMLAEGDEVFTVGSFSRSVGRMFPIRTGVPGDEEIVGYGTVLKVEVDEDGKGAWVTYTPVAIRGCAGDCANCPCKS